MDRREPPPRSVRFTHEFDDLVDELRKQYPLDLAIEAAAHAIARSGERHLVQANRGLYATEGTAEVPRLVIGFTLDDAQFFTFHRIWVSPEFRTRGDEPV